MVENRYLGFEFTIRCEELLKLPRSKSIDEEIKRYAVLNLEKGNPVTAKKLFKKINDTENLINTYNYFVKENNFYDAWDIAFTLNNSKKMKITTKNLEENCRGQAIFDVLFYYKEDVREKYNQDLKEYIINKGFNADKVPKMNSREFGPVAYVAKKIAPKYDYSVILARGGLSFGHAFDLAGISTVTAKTKRRPQGVSLEWLDDPKCLKDSSILVVDDDVVKGETLTRVYNELRKYTSKNIDAYLGSNMVDARIINAVPKEFSEIYYNTKFTTHDGSYDMFKILKKKFDVIKL